MRTHKVDATRIIPPSNIFGDHGPRCRHCSGLGAVLRLSPYGVTKNALRCTCGGSGVDLEIVQAAQMSNIISKMDRLEKQHLRDAKKIQILSRTLHDQGKMSRQAWEELIAWATSDGTAVANSAVEAVVFPNITLPGNYMQDGRVLELILQGRIGATATPTMTFRLRWGGLAGTVIAATAAITLAAVTAAIFKISVNIQTRANGVSGSLFAIGDVQWGQTIKTTNTPDMMGSAGATTPAAVTVDLTADTALGITATWGTANASNTLTGHNEFLASRN
jgi:hypothetical protein